jgi:hypothetical protein
MTRPLIALALLGVVGCKPMPSDKLENDAVLPAHFHEHVVVWTDPSNGCEYLLYAEYKQGGITPRLNPDGTQICERPEGQKEE